MNKYRIAAMLIVFGSAAVGLADESLAGQRVLVKRAGVKIGYNQDGRWVDAGEVKDVAVTVLEQRDDWLLIRSAGKRGWMPKSEAMPIRQATEYYTDLIKREPNTPSHFLRRGVSWHERGEFDKAITDYTEAIRLSPKDAAAFYNRAIAWHLRKKYAEALKDYTETVNLDPNYAWAYSNRAWLRSTCPDRAFRDGAEAVKDARRACELTEWKDADCVENLAAAFAENNQFDEAVKYQKTALEFPHFDKDNGTPARARLKLYEQKQPYRSDSGN